MANGTDSEEYVVLSGIRRGLKREFAFAWKSQSEFAGVIGRRRMTRYQNVYSRRGVSYNSSNKRLKSSTLKETKGRVEKPSTEIEPVHEIVGSTRDEAAGNETENDRDRVASAIEDEEPKSDSVDLNSENDRKNGMVESVGEETKDEAVEKAVFGNEMVRTTGGDDAAIDAGEAECEGLPGVEDHAKQSDEKIKCRNALEASSLGGDVVGENALLEKPFRRITRPALKQNEELPEMSGSMDLKAEEIAEVGPEDTRSTVAAKGKLEKKMSKKVVLKRFPTKLKELLETGLLEGLPVRYLRGLKARAHSDSGLPGIIKGTGILCCWDTCGGTEVVTPNQFELHAGSGNKRPPEYIYLENGNTLRDLLNACRDAPLDDLEVAILKAIGSAKNKQNFCLNCKGSIPEAGAGKTMRLCNSCVVVSESQPRPPQMNDTSERSLLSTSTTKLSDCVSHCSSSQSKGQGRLTRKDLRMHKLVFEEDVLADGTALAYYARGQKLLDGYKRGFGIFCLCCNSEVSPSQFEAHAGWASRRKPYLHIYTSNGVSLHELSIRLSQERKLSADENDDLCSICADGGDLLCCDTCPRAFHTECVSLQSMPNGTWYCKYCQNMFQKEKFVERNANAVAAGRVAGIDPIEQITQRCIRIVKTSEVEVGGCALCRGHDFSKSGFGPRTVILCDQCEKEYHVGCLKEHSMDDLQELPQGKWFCCMDCYRIHSTLQKQVADGEEKLPDSLLNVIKKKHEEKGSEVCIDLDIRWRLLSGKMASDEARVLLSKAVSIFHDRFDPIANANTSSIDLIPHMVYGRNLRDQEFGGMYCAILMVNSTVVSAGIIRIFGKDVAELPLVATSSDCQGQGYFQSLFCCIQNLLESLNIQTLVLPAAEEAEPLWVNKFGFDKIAQEQLMQYRKHYQMMVFQGTSMLHKAISKS